MSPFTSFTFLFLSLAATNFLPASGIPSRRTAAPLLNAATCGRNAYGAGGDKIVGGHEARKHEFPWLVSLWVEYEEYGMDQHMCGGTLIHPQYVLTAAHCSKEVGGPTFENPKVWKALIGAHNFADLDTDKSVQWVKIEKIMVNTYSILNKVNDIAIWKLAEPVKIDTESWTSNTLCLPDPDEKLDLSKLKCTVAGWGKLQENGIPATVLQEVSLPVISVSKCREYYPENVWYPRKIHDSNLCVGLEEGGKDSCQGDSGGPYMCVHPTKGNYFLAGIVSWGYGCANARMPGVVTNPIYFLRWIASNMAKMQ